DTRLRRKRGPSMTPRRECLGTTTGALAGLAFGGCALLAAAPVRAQTRRREVVVSGRRGKTVDVHAHCAVAEAMALVGMTLGAPAPPTRPELSMVTHVSERLRAMDEQGIDVEALSINPYWYKTERDLARQICQIQNSKLGEACAAHPDRFVAFATVALQYPDLAAEQLEDGVKSCGAPAGGYLPSYAARSDLGCSPQPTQCPGGPHGPIKKKPTEYLKQMYYDTMVFTPEGLRHLAAEVGASRLMIGTDFPYP